MDIVPTQQKSETGATVRAHRTRSVYRLTRGEDGRVRATNGRAFSPEGYSLFKHGDERWARRFGHEVADLLMAEEAGLLDGIRSDGVLVAAFPYKYVPTAAARMVDHALTRLNHVLCGEGKPTVGYLHAFKFPWQASIEHHFAGMGKDARKRILDNVGLSVDEYRLRGADLIVVDDVRVTGASQDKFLELLYGVGSLRSLTVVFLCDMDPAVAEREPAIESELNHAKVRTLGDVAAIVAAGGFRWNVRVAKFVLEQGDAEAFGAFVRGLGDGPLLALYSCVVLNEYHLEEKYGGHVPVLRSEVEARGLV